MLIELIAQNFFFDFGVRPGDTQGSNLAVLRGPYVEPEFEPGFSWNCFVTKCFNLCTLSLAPDYLFGAFSN